MSPVSDMEKYPETILVACLKSNTESFLVASQVG